MERFSGTGPSLPEGTCGTQPSIGGISPADRFEMEFEAACSARALRGACDTRALPLVG
jgi:hypothetical protein